MLTSIGIQSIWDEIGNSEDLRQQLYIETHGFDFLFSGLLNICLIAESISKEEGVLNGFLLFAERIHAATRLTM